jgi:hypothetical protein
VLTATIAALTPPQNSMLQIRAHNGGRREVKPIGPASQIWQGRDIRHGVQPVT